MTNREELLRAYSRYLVPDLLIVQLLSAKNPDFFQRLFGRWEAKVEKAQEDVRAAPVEYEQLKWEISQLERARTEGQQEFDRLPRNTDA